MSDRLGEIVEAVTLLHDLGKPVELICRQMDLKAAEVVAIVNTGQIPARQKELFSKPSEHKKHKPQSRWEPVIEACKIHPAGKPTNQQT